MQITINGEEKQLKDNLNIQQLIEQLGLTEQRLAMEVNREIVPRSRFAEHHLQAGDQIEIVRAIGGGAQSTFRRHRCPV